MITATCRGCWKDRGFRSVKHWKNGVCRSCQKNGRSAKTAPLVDVPVRGSSDWYKDRWFRKDQKTWEADIRSRRSVVSDGSVVGRFNESGERIG